MPLFLFIFVLSQLITLPLFAQDLRNRADEMYHLGKVVISNQALPDKVFEVQKNKVLVSIFFIDKQNGNHITTSLGTGFVSETPGVIVTARHVLNETITELEIHKNELARSNIKFDYTYIIMGTIITRDAWIDFPLSLVAVGETGTFKDILVLRTDVETLQRASLAGDIINPNPYAILLKTSKFADANTGERIYISGLAPVVAEYQNKNNKPVSSYVDMINYTFPAEVTAKIEDMPINRAGVKLLYRLHDSAEPGFSGGIVLNDKGHVVGMTISMTKSQNFIYIISSKDIKQFLKDHEIK